MTGRFASRFSNPRLASTTASRKYAPAPLRANTRPIPCFNLAGSAAEGETRNAATSGRTTNQGFMSGREPLGPSIAKLLQRIALPFLDSPRTAWYGSPSSNRPTGDAQGLRSDLPLHPGRHRLRGCHAADFAAGARREAERGEARAVRMRHR